MVKKRILHIVLDMEYGGLEKVIYNIIKNNDPNQLEISLCCLDSGGSVLDQIKRMIDVKTFIIERKPGIIDFRALRKLYRIIKENNIDIIHSHSGCLLYSTIIGRLSCVKKINYTDHGRLIPDRFGAKIEDSICSYFIDNYISVSPELKKYLEKELWISKKKIKLINNGIDTNEFMPIGIERVNEIKKEEGIKEKYIVGCVCRLEEIKNVTYLIENLKHFIQTKNILLLIIGDGKEKEKILLKINQLKIQNNVMLLGRRDDVNRLMPIFNVFVLSSLSEGTSLTILEAMACAVTPVVSRVGGNINIVNEGKDGFLFELDNPKKMIQSIDIVLKNPAKAKTLGKNARLKVMEKYSIEHMSNEYNKLY